MAIIVNELRPVTDYPDMSWQSLLKELNLVNTLQRVLDDYDLRKELIGLYMTNLQDESDIAAYRIRIRARNRRIAQLVEG